MITGALLCYRLYLVFKQQTIIFSSNLSDNRASNAVSRADTLQEMLYLHFLQSLVKNIYVGSKGDYVIFVDNTQSFDWVYNSASALRQYHSDYQSDVFSLFGGI
jgi:hypothetical protein